MVCMKIACVRRRDDVETRSQEALYIIAQQLLAPVVMSHVARVCFILSMSPLLRHLASLSQSTALTNAWICADVMLIAVQLFDQSERTIFFFFLFFFQMFFVCF